jgi:hypothetical protein
LRRLPIGGRLLLVAAGTVAVAAGVLLVRSSTDPLRPTSRVGLVNPAHLDFLTEPIEVGGRRIAIVHIYSEYPAYRWVDASGEGITALDDIARAALVYLELGRDGRDPPAMERARLLLETVLYLQTDDGDYHNFLRDRAGTINVDGPTSYEDWGWWAARGQRALVHGYAGFRDVDPSFAVRLRDAYERGEVALERALDELSPTAGSLHGVRQPAGLLKGGTDVSGLALLGLAEWYETEPNDKTRRLAFRLGQAVAEARSGDALDYPFGLRPSTTSSTAFWHAWGAHDVEALAVAGRVFERNDWVASAQAQADAWYGRLLTGGMIREIGVLPRRYDQIAYGQAPMVLGFTALWDATGDERYRRLAGLAAAWFLGDNSAGAAMYDETTGRGFDGLAGANELRINRNSGAESTIEALLALLAVTDDPVASAHLTARSDEPPDGGLILEAERGATTSGSPRYGLQEWTGEAFYSGGRFEALGAGDVLSIPFSLDEAGTFDLYLAHLRQAPTARRLDLEAVRADRPPEIDGDPGDWPETKPIEIDAVEQILRGAAAWPGRERASLAVRLAWDADNLFVFADVRDPEHVQNGAGPDVWRGDAVWLYLDTTGAGSRIDVKLTLAQATAGPQVWDWVGQGFLPQATLAWTEVEGGYRYEAALPWESLHRTEGAAGGKLGMEIGMGFAGGFIDWTGTDPDTPANLAPLTLVDRATELASAEQRDPRPDAVALAVELDGQPIATMAARTSPDRDYLWLDRLAGPIDLEAGEHEIGLTYAGLDQTGESVVDGLWLVPRPLERRWSLADGSDILVRLDPVTGVLHLQP